MGTTPIITMRLDPDLAVWAAGYAPALYTDRTGLVRELLETLRDRRLVLLPTPVPTTPNTGADPHMPVLICPSPR